MCGVPAPLTEWRPTGAVVHFAVSTLGTAGLRSCLPLADALPPRTPHAESLPATARALLTCRRTVGDFDVLQRGLEAAARGVVAREAEAELARYATEVEDRDVCSALLDALQV